jgi:hypothetical protein
MTKIKTPKKPFNVIFRRYRKAAERDRSRRL